MRKWLPNALSVLLVVSAVVGFVRGQRTHSPKSIFAPATLNRMPDGVREQVFKLMEALSGPSIVDASDKVKEEASATLEGFILAIGPVLDRAIQDGNLDDFVVLRQRMMGDRDGEDLTRHIADQLKQDRKLYGPAVSDAKSSTTTKVLGGPKPKPGIGD